MAEAVPVDNIVRLRSDDMMDLLKPLASFSLRARNVDHPIVCRNGELSERRLMFDELKMRLDAQLDRAGLDPSSSPTVRNSWLPVQLPAESRPSFGSLFALVGDPGFLSARGLTATLTSPINSASNVGAFLTVPAVDTEALSTASGLRIIPCAGSAALPGQFSVDVSFCRDTQWPSSMRPTPAGFESVTGCGPVGWSRDAQNKPTLRIPWRVRVSGLSLTADLFCEAVFADPNSPGAQACRTINQVPCLRDSRARLTLASRSPTQPIEFVFETNLTPTPCSRTGGDGRPLCPTFVGQATSPNTPINLPNMALVPSFGISAIRQLNSDGSYGQPLSFSQLSIRLSNRDPASQVFCNSILENAANSLSPTVISVLEPLLLPMLAQPITQALFTGPDAPMRNMFPAPTEAITPIAPPTCAADFSSSLAGGLACATQWIPYAMQRSAYRYITGPFNGPESTNINAPSHLWNHWDLAFGEDPNRRRTLVVNVAPPSASNRLTCSNRLPRNPTLSVNFDGDGDGIPDACDNCPNIPNRSQNNCNSESEFNLGRRVPGVDLLGDACDPNPCATVRELTPATTPSLTLDDRQTNQWLGQLNVRPTRAPSSVVAATDDTVVVGETAARRCVCGRIDETGQFIQDSSLANCRELRCRRNGARGVVGQNNNFQSTDWRLRNEPCTTRVDEPGRCDVNPTERYIPEVTQGTLASGRTGRERDVRSLYQWDYKSEYLRGALMAGNELRSQAQLLESYIPSLSAYLWTRADRREGTSAPERLRDHYSFTDRPISLRLNEPPFANTFARLSLNRCAIAPRLCSFLPIGGLRGIANFVAPRPPAGQPGLHRFVTTLGLSAAQLAQAPELAGDRGELAAPYAALAVGVYDAESQRFTALGASFGEVPPLDGSVVVTSEDQDGAPMVVAVGGDTADGPSPYLYEGRVILSDNGTYTQWTRSLLSVGSSDVFGAGPRPRTQASLVSDGRTVYLYGGNSPEGPLHDLWKYDTVDHTWSVISLDVAPAGSQGSAMALSDQWLVIYGGRDDNQALSSQLFAMQRETGHFVTWQTNATPSLRSSVAVYQDRVWIYAGETEQGPSDVLREVSLQDGTLLREIHTGIASSGGAALGLDPDGTLSILALGQPAQSTQSAVLVGAPDQLVSVRERASNGAEACDLASASRVGLACEQPSQVGSTLGSLVCNQSSVACLASRTTTVQQTFAGQVFALDAQLLAIASGGRITLRAADAVDTVIAEADDGLTVQGIALSSRWLFTTNGNSIRWRTLSARASNWPIAGELQTCGNLRALRVVGDTLYADSVFGVERFEVSANGLTRVPEHVFATALDQNNPRAMCQQVSDNALTFCRAVTTFFRAPLERLQAKRSWDVTSDGALWITQGARVFVFGTRPNGRLQLTATLTTAAESLVVRAVGTQLAVLGHARNGTVVRDTLALGSRDGQPVITRVGEHALHAWIEERPELVGATLVRRSAHGVEIRSAN